MSAIALTVPARPAVARPLLVGTLAVCLFFGGLGGWAATAPLSAAAHATGQVRVAGYRKTVQHLEGGIVSAILVKEGDLVREGQVLVQLDDLQAGADTSVLQSQYDALTVLQARLVAERDGQFAITLSPELQVRSADAGLAQIIETEQRLFDSRQIRERGRISMLRQRISQLGWEIDSYRSQVEAGTTLVVLNAQKLATARGLVEKGVSAAATLLPLEMEQAQLKGNRGQQMALLSRTLQAIREAELEIIEVGNARLEEAAVALRDTQARLFEIADRLRAAADVQQRTAVVAPQDGRVLGLRMVTVGGVVRPGDALLDLVPDDGQFVIEVRVSPSDIDTVRVGQEAEVKFSAFKQRDLPILLGTVSIISADALIDQRTGMTYFSAEIILPLDALAQVEGMALYPGMPADAMIRTQERTVLQYFIDPIQDSFRRALRDS